MYFITITNETRNQKWILTKSQINTYVQLSGRHCSCSTSKMNVSFPGTIDITAQSKQMILGIPFKLQHYRKFSSSALLLVLYANKKMVSKHNMKTDQQQHSFSMNRDLYTKVVVNFVWHFNAKFTKESLFYGLKGFCFNLQVKFMYLGILLSLKKIGNKIKNITKLLIRVFRK